MMSARQVLDIARAVVRPVAARAWLTVARGVVKLVDDSLKCQGLQIVLLADEVHDDVERFQEYGFTSVPFTGAEVLSLAVGGNRGHSVVVCVNDRRHRPTGLAEGDVALHTDKGVRVRLDRETDETLLGNNPSAYVARADRTDARIDALQQAFDGHFHMTTATVGPSPTPGMISVPTVSIGQLDTVAADAVKAE